MNERAQFEQEILNRVYICNIPDQYASSLLAKNHSIVSQKRLGLWSKVKWWQIPRRAS